MFDKLEIGKKYTQIELAEIWNYKSYHAIRRGIVTPKGKNIIVLFITEEKISYATQYKDHLDGKILYMQGENKHGHDDRLLNSIGNDEIHLFFRLRHHMPYEYMGKVHLIDFEIKIDTPSLFTFKLENK
ncbi:hypothetical protein PM724_12660 [Erysipelatoclostridium ramosum]|uniref:hypothetical protein n=1 Tax=Thomasclavelia ramosa TaxID=1547 RepID=UPI0018AC2D83|nr:hypothetical protein [Thomasclavelia ramosa]MDB7094773.1 hypothetical protein [Thomasclavelia ramosa]